MASPIVIPPGIRVPLAQLGSEPIDIGQTSRPDQGELRRRPRYTSVPQQASVVWLLTQTEFDTFWDWFEADLVAGSSKFDLQLERQGGPGAGSNPRLQWWTAQFVGMPQEEVLSGFRYRITATLLLLGQPFDTRLAPGLSARLRSSHTLRATTRPGTLRARLASATLLRVQVGQPPLRVGMASASLLRWNTGLASQEQADTEEELTRLWMRFKGARLATDRDESRAFSFMRL